MVGVSLRDEALAAAENEDRAAAIAEAKRKREEEVQRLALLAERSKAADELLAASPLPEWFPTAHWEWYGEQLEGQPAIFCTERPDGADPTYAGVPLFQITKVVPRGQEPRIEVRCVLPKTEDGYLRYVGSVIHRKGDIGRHIRDALDPATAALKERRGEG